jgi:hypothetical protein
MNLISVFFSFCSAKPTLKHPNVYTFSTRPSYIGETQMLRHARQGKTALSWRKIAQDNKRDSGQDSSAETAVLGISDWQDSVLLDVLFSSKKMYYILYYKL